MDPIVERNATGLRGFCEDRDLIFTETEEASGVPRFDVRQGQWRCIVKLFSTGKVLVQGAASPLFDSLTSLKERLERGETLNPKLDLNNVSSDLARLVPGVDKTVVSLLEEAALCLKVGANLGCAYLMGAASEKAILILIDTYEAAIPDAVARDKFQNRRGSGSIKRQFDAFFQSWRSSQNRPQGFAAWNEPEMKIEQMFQTYRMCRNEAGHPSVPPDLDPEMLHSMLNYLPKHLRNIYELINFYNSTSVML